MPEPNETEVVATTETKPEVTESLTESMAKFVEGEYGKAAAEESSAAQTEETTEAKAADTTEAKADETPVQAAPEPFTTEQISDPKFWDSLDKAGWERAAKLHPVETARVKASYAAASKIAAAAKAKSEPAEERTEAPKQLNADWKEALRKANSLDEDEAIEGQRLIAKLTLREALPEFGINPAETQARAIERNAYQIAVEGLPELDSLSDDVLNAAVEADPFLMQNVQIAASLPAQQSVALLANVMKQAGSAVLAKQKAEETSKAATAAAEAEKKQAQQKKVRSNANIASNVVVEQPFAGKPTKDETPEQYINRMWQEAAARAAT
jgi:hypothetical protein